MLDLISELFISADVQQINRAFQNLILNAINSIVESKVERGIIDINKVNKGDDEQERNQLC